MFAAMAMYIETTREKGNADATTLEEAAEELLNGLLCHYEPPHPRTQQKMREEAGGNGIKRSQSILKSAKEPLNKRKGTKRQSVGQRVRWKDEQNKLKAPDIYDIGKGCQEALGECNSRGDAVLEQQTRRLAELSSQREPRPISKRSRNNSRRSDGLYDQQNHSMATFSEDSINLMNNYGGNGSGPRSNDPISNYRVATMSPNAHSQVTDDADSLFDDLGNIVVEENTKQDIVMGQRRSQYGPPPSPAARNEHPPPPPPHAPSLHRRVPTPYKQPRTPSDEMEPSTLCGIMCDPKYLNCEVKDGDYEDSENFQDYAQPPPPPPPPQYYYEDPENSLVSESDGGGNYSDSEQEEEKAQESSKRGLRSRFKRKSKKKSSRTEEPKSPSRKSRARSRSRSPGRRTSSKSPGRSKSPGKSSLKDKKFPKSPMSFITGNRSFSPRASESGKEESEANFSMQSMASETANSSSKAPKSPKSPRRKWFGRSKKSAEEEQGAGGSESETPRELMPDNDDWAPPAQRRPPLPGNNNMAGVKGQERGRIIERQGQGRRQSSDGMDIIDRARMSDFVDPNEEQLQALGPTRSRSLERPDERGSRLPNYAESHIGLSRMSFDEPEENAEQEEQRKPTRGRSLEKLDWLLRPRRGRSKERQDKDAELLPSRSHSLDRQDELLPSRSRSLDRQDQRSHGGFENGYNSQPMGQTPIGRGVNDQESLMRGRRRSFDSQLDPRTSSYPFVPQGSYPAYTRGYPPPGYYDNRGFFVPAQQYPPHQWHQRPPPMVTREEYLDNQYNNFMAQRSPSYPPPSTPTGGIREGISQMWGELTRSQSADQRKMAVEPPAAVYSHVQEPPQQMASIYSHDPTAPAVQPLEGRGMPPTPMQREQFQQPYSQQYANERQMPPTPMQGGYPMYAQPVQEQQSYPQATQPVQTQRDPTPRNQLVDFIQSQFQQVQASKPPSPPKQRPFNVAEEIHRVSWGEARRDSRDEREDQQQVQLSQPQQPAYATQDIHPTPMIPPTLPGKAKSKSQSPLPPPPPPPPPPMEQPKQQTPAKKQATKPPRPTMIPEATQTPPEENQVHFNDTIDENEPVEHGHRKDGKGGRKLLGIFNRNKKKKTAPSKRPGAKPLEADSPDNDVGSIISDAVLRDRHDRFVTNL